MPCEVTCIKNFARSVFLTRHIPVTSPLLVLSRADPSTLYTLNLPGRSLDSHCDGFSLFYLGFVVDYGLSVVKHHGRCNHVEMPRVQSG